MKWEKKLASIYPNLNLLDYWLKPIKIGISFPPLGYNQLEIGTLHGWRIHRIHFHKDCIGQKPKIHSVATRAFFQPMRGLVIDVPAINIFKDLQSQNGLIYLLFFLRMNQRTKGWPLDIQNWNGFWSIHFLFFFQFIVVVLKGIHFLYHFCFLYSNWHIFFHDEERRRKNPENIV